MPTATSLRLAGSATTDRATVLRAVLRALSARLAELETAGFAGPAAAYRERCSIPFFFLSFPSFSLCPLLPFLPCLCCPACSTPGRAKTSKALIQLEQKCATRNKVTRQRCKFIQLLKT